jgi:5-hydroxyisourate hydrolase
MSGITTHVLDTARGQPASGVPITLEFKTAGSWKLIGEAKTDADGRAGKLVSQSVKLHRGTYRIRFDTAAYFSAQGTESFYREVTVVFLVKDPRQHYHVPLLLSPFGYSTYRGS